MDGITIVIAQLERQKAAIDNALAALRGIDGSAPPASDATSEPVSASRKGGMTPEGKRRLVKALKKRWAAKKAAAAQETPVVAPVKATRKGGMTEEGRKRLAEAMKRRWAVKRAGSAVKKRAGGPKKAA
jgi:hypothetical protein